MGGVLHQMSIAALVIAIGILVDSATDIAEDVQSRLDAGATHLDARRGAVASLAVPLGSAAGNRYPDQFMTTLDSERRSPARG